MGNSETITQQRERVQVGERAVKVCVCETIQVKAQFRSKPPCESFYSKNKRNETTK